MENLILLWNTDSKNDSIIDYKVPIMHHRNLRRYQYNISIYAMPIKKVKDDF